MLLTQPSEKLLVPQSNAPRVLLINPSTQYTKFLVEQLWLKGLLYRTCTSLSAAEDSLLARWFLYRFPLRVIQQVPDSKIVRRPFSFMRSKVLSLFSSRSMEEQQFDWFAQFQERLPQRLLRSADIVIGYDTSSWILAQRVNTLGKPFILDYSGVPHRKMFQCLISAYGEGVKEMPGFPYHPQNMLDCYARELEQADTITHASSFVGDSLKAEGVPASKLTHIPYGVELCESPKRAKSSDGAPTRFLFVGSSVLRKGSRFLVDAFANIEGNAELHLFGWGGFDPIEAAESKGRIVCRGQIPHTELLAELPEFDVMVLPSLAEGFGLVVLEAMTAGLPVIVTDHVGAADVVRDGVSGYIVPAGDVHALQRTMQQFVNSPGLAFEMGLKARTDASAYSWDTYGERWDDLLRSISL